VRERTRKAAGDEEWEGLCELKASPSSDLQHVFIKQEINKQQKEKGVNKRETKEKVRQRGRIEDHYSKEVESIDCIHRRDVLLSPNLESDMFFRFGSIC
jgi:hypothetical protein